MISWLTTGNNIALQSLPVALGQVGSFDAGYGSSIMSRLVSTVDNSSLIFLILMSHKSNNVIYTNQDALYTCSVNTEDGQTFFWCLQNWENVNKFSLCRWGLKRHGKCGF